MSMDPADWFPLRTATVNFWVPQTPDECKMVETHNLITLARRGTFSQLMRHRRATSATLSKKCSTPTAPTAKSSCANGCCTVPPKDPYIAFLVLLCKQERTTFWSQVGSVHRTRRLKTHERSECHRQCVLYLCKRCSLKTSVIRSLEEHYSERATY